MCAGARSGLRAARIAPGAEPTSNWRLTGRSLQRMNRSFALASALALLASSSLSITSTTHAATAASSAATEPQFRELYKELVETNTSLSAGSCTLAAERMAARLKAAGYPDEDF